MSVSSATMAQEVPTKELLNRLFSRQEDVPVCPKCHGTGLWFQLECSQLDPELLVDMPHRCNECPNGKIPCSNGKL